jgi:hypothetical protein
MTRASFYFRHGPVGENEMANRDVLAIGTSAGVMSVALDENLRRALASASRALEERVALACKLYRQAVDGVHRLLADTWAEKAREFEREMDVIPGSIRRMDRIAAAEEAKAPRAAE